LELESSKSQNSWTIW